MMPILSISTHYEYADLLMPTVEDWLTSISLNKTFIHSMNCSVKHSPVNSEWVKKKDMFLFRGYIDDCGMDILTNRKLKIVYIGMDNDKMDAKLIRNKPSTHVYSVSGPNRINIESIPEFIQLENGENYLPVDQFYCNHSEYIPFTQYHTYKHIIVCSSIIETSDYLNYLQLNHLLLKLKIHILHRLIDILNHLNGKQI